MAATIGDLAAAQARPVAVPPAEDCAAVIAGCDAKLARYQAALDAGADPVTVAGWTKDVTASVPLRSPARRPASRSGATHRRSH